MADNDNDLVDSCVEKKVHNKGDLRVFTQN